jgi:hypothetical protein
MTPTEAKQQRRKLQKEIAAELRAQDRIKLHQLDQHITAARKNRRAALIEVRRICKLARFELKERQKQERERVRDEQRRQRLERRVGCQAARVATSLDGKSEIERLRLERKRTKAEQRIIERAGKVVRVRSTAKERKQESDDTVRRDIPAELVPVFDKVRARIKGSARRSRSEEFLEWAHENPDEVLAVQQADADRYLVKLVKEQRAHKGEMRKASRYKLTDEQVKKRLADVPF